MTKILQLVSRSRSPTQQFSVDVYASDRKKYQFEIVADSVTAVYFQAVSKAFREGASQVRCIAIFKGLVEERSVDQAPVKVWQLQDVTAAGRV